MELAAIVRRYRSGETSDRSNPSVQGISDVQILTFENGDRCVIKTQDRSYNDSEIAAAIIGKALGFNCPDIIRLNDETIMMNFINGRTGFDMEERTVLDYETRKWMNVFDYLIMNGDRHDGNWMVEEDGTSWFIDHGFCFFGGKRLSWTDCEVLSKEWIDNAYSVIQGLRHIFDEYTLGYGEFTFETLESRVMDLYDAIGH